MTYPKPTTPPHAPDAYEPLTSTERIEADVAVAGLAAGEALRGVELALVVLLGVLVCPPLAILAVLVVVPLVVTALILGLIAAVLSAPYLLVHHLRSHDRRHASLLAHRLRRAGRALFDVLPHRIVADARKLGHTGR
jgi:hypothetical protein